MSKQNNLRTPKGTYDLTPEETAVKNKIERICENIFKKHCGMKIETPHFELRENLQDKYGEDTKLIFNLEDQGGDICSLRYDLTIPFSRFISKNKIHRIRKYQIGSVFRRDNPSRGRLREFTQADFDLTGNNLPMINDSECIKMINDILEELVSEFTVLDDFIIKINDRRILRDILKYCEVEEENRMNICSTIDKFDKMNEEELSVEFRKKGMNEEQIEKLFRILKMSKVTEGNDLLEKLDEIVSKEVLDEFRKLIGYLEIYKITKYKIDLTLARGLTYYTGIIVEGVFTGLNIGSICGGGRYDKLCSSISTFETPCVGFSIGVSRILNGMFTHLEKKYLRNDILVGSAYGLCLKERMRLVDVLQEKYSAMMMHGEKMNYKAQIAYAESNSFKMIIFTGEKEIENGIVQLYFVAEKEKKEIKQENLLETIEMYLNKL